MSINIAHQLTVCYLTFYILVVNSQDDFHFINEDRDDWIDPHDFTVQPKVCIIRYHCLVDIDDMVTPS